MSLLQLTEYLLWKSIKHKSTSTSSNLNILKEECTIKKETFDNNVICRVCTNSAEIPVTDKIGETLIISAIRMVANISISEADNYPKYICKICLEELKIAFEFKKKCEASDMLFRKAISSEIILVTGSQPLVKHDFSLLIHQLKEKRAHKMYVKKDEQNDYEDFVNEAESTPSHLFDDTFNKKINKIPEIQSRKSVSVMDNSTHNHIINLFDKFPGQNDDNVQTTSNDQNEKLKMKKGLKIHKCIRCNLRFDNKAELQKHKKNNSCTYNACLLCGKLVFNLVSHERVVHSRTHKYTCHHCGKIYYSSGALNNHMHKHKDTKEYYCDHCPYRGKRKSYLVCHMRVHTGERRYLCSMCPMKFTNPSNLTKHQLVHFNKKFECSKCKRLFRQQRHLKEHFDAAHLNIRYRCTICSRDLTSRKKLLNHELRVHKREKNKLFEELQRVVIGNDNDF